MKSLRHERAAENPDGGRKEGVKCVRPFARLQLLIDKIDMRTLSERVDTRVGSTGTVNAHAFSGYFMKSTLKMILNGVAMTLTLPAAKRASIISQGQLQPPRHKE